MMAANLVPAAAWQAVGAAGLFGGCHVFDWQGLVLHHSGSRSIKQEAILTAACVGSGVGAASPRIVLHQAGSNTHRVLLSGWPCRLDG